MGASSKKTHESFAVLPATSLSKSVLSPGGVSTVAVDAVPDDGAPVPEETLVFDVDPTATVGEPNASVNEGDLVTPIPDDLMVGEATGTPLLAGGADLFDSLVTLVAYKSGDTTREVLYATVDERAEEKLLEALAVGEKLVPMQVTEEVAGRLPMDKEHQLHEQLVVVAKSINHHFKKGTSVPSHTIAKVEAVALMLQHLNEDLTTDDDKAMVAHYDLALAAIKERLEPTYSTPYESGGKVPMVKAFETMGEVSVTKYVAALSDERPGLLHTEVRGATRISPTLDADGMSSWDGTARSKANGKEYLVDLGDGYSAVYRPYGANDASSTEFSLRGALEIMAPAGSGNSGELVSRLGHLNLVNRPMSHAEAEWTYLQRNVWAQRLETSSSVVAAMEQAHGLEDAVEHVLFSEQAHKAVGMSDVQLHAFAKDLRLEAEARALPEKVRVLREGVAQATGCSDGAALATSAGYQPVPRRSAGWWVWDRFDVAANESETAKAFKSRGLMHHVTGGNVADLFRSGVLASTERRHLMGIAGGKGMSESADKASGGASSVFLRVRGKPSSGPALFWDRPTKLLSRADWYAYDGDHFGSLNPKSSHSTGGQVRDPLQLSSFSSSNNEVMFRHGIDLLGHEAPSLVKCVSAKQRDEVLAVLAEKGVSALGGRPVEEVVQC